MGRARARGFAGAYGSFGAATLAASALVTAGAAADEGARGRPETGLELGVHVGIAHPGGAVGTGSSATTPNVADLAPGALPFGLDVGYRFTPNAYIGGAFDWAPAFGDGSGLCVACAFRYDLQGRAVMRYDLAPARTFDPWGSFGVGWELLHVVFGDSPSASASYSGPVFSALEVGLDVRSRGFAIGPYFGMSLATFVARSLSPAPTGEPSIEGHSVHEWFTLGLRGTYGPW